MKMSWKLTPFDGFSIRLSLIDALCQKKKKSNTTNYYVLLKRESKLYLNLLISLGRIICKLRIFN